MTLPLCHFKKSSFTSHGLLPTEYEEQSKQQDTHVVLYHDYYRLPMIIGAHPLLFNTANSLYFVLYLLERLLIQMAVHYTY